jgi:glycosyltransferase involved in cell wall biosynthesis
LAALEGQALMPDRVVVIVRADDVATLDIANAWQARLPVRIAEVSRPGQVHALNTGLSHCDGGIAAITDDDAAPRRDWTERIAAHFAADPALGGVGGRDWVHRQGAVETGERHVVGVVRWYGQVIGNHHLGAGPAREVEILKGANCAFRLAAIGPIGFDPRLRGRGAQVHNDMLASLAVKHAGWRLVYDPLVAVDHWPAPRNLGTERGERSSEIAFDTAYNQVLALAFLRPALKRAMAVGWEFLVGTADKPGLLWLLKLCASREPMAFSCWMSANRGRYVAIRGWRT